MRAIALIVPSAPPILSGENGASIDYFAQGGRTLAGAVAAAYGLVALGAQWPILRSRGAEIPSALFQIKDTAAARLQADGARRSRRR